MLWISMGVVLGLASASARAANPDEFEVFSYDLLHSGPVELPGRLFVPTNYDPSQSYPLVVFLHGVGSPVGSNNTSQITHGGLDNLLANAKTRDFFLYAPQSSNGFWPDREQKRIVNMLAEATTQYNIDSSRLLLTGYSGGGGGTWKMLENYTDVFAAGVPIAGSESDLSLAPNMVGKPIWAFHAQNDGTVSVGITRTHINAIRNADGLPSLTFPLGAGTTFYSHNNLQYTEYTTGGHGINGTVLNTAAMYNWLLSQSNASTVTTLQKDKTILFDFGTINADIVDSRNIDSQGRYWNSGDTQSDATLGIAVGFAQTSEGQRTSVHLRVTDTFTSRAALGVTEGSRYDAAIAGDYWFTGASGNIGAQSQPGIIVLSGLAPGGEYKITLFASSDDDGGRGRITRYIIGDLIRDLDAAFNLQDTAVFESVFANELGELELIVTVPAGITSRYGLLGAMEITAINLNGIPEPATASLLLGATLLLTRRHRAGGRHTTLRHHSCLEDSL
jgi:dienelactone hydrolase